METTFISIHDLSLDARLLYVSQSIPDILGYQPQEVVGKSCWEYFHPDEIPFAQSIHSRTIQMEKAAVLKYCRIKHKDGRWRGCECVFTVVHDHIVASTSIYKNGPQQEKRRRDAPVIRQMFASSPRDPRYHMLQYISSKFRQRIQPEFHEPRAALFLNRFSRTLTIMYATNGLADLLGITNDQLTGKSFYFCMQENCLREGVKCLESAKANDSIAYLRFWFRDPTQEDLPVDPDERMSDSAGDDDDGGVSLSEQMDRDGSGDVMTTGSSIRSPAERNTQKTFSNPNSRSQSGNSTDSTDMGTYSSDNMFDRADNQQSRTSSITTPDDIRASSEPWSPQPASIELEAVVSCTSDGLVVILRGARPYVQPSAPAAAQVVHHPYQNGLFATPWANNPILPDMNPHTGPQPNIVTPPRFPVSAIAQQAEYAAAKGPASETVMNSIRDVAVFAWALTGINGSLAQYGRGQPSGESQPQRLQVWQPNGNGSPGPSGNARPSETQNGWLNGKGQLPDIRCHTYDHITGLPRYSQIKGNGFSSHHHQDGGPSNMNMDGASDDFSPQTPQYQSHQSHPTGNGYGSNGHTTNGWHSKSHNDDFEQRSFHQQHQQKPVQAISQWTSSG